MSYGSAVSPTARSRNISSGSSHPMRYSVVSASESFPDLPASEFFEHDFLNTAYLTMVRERNASNSAKSSEDHFNDTSGLTAEELAEMENDDEYLIDPYTQQFLMSLNQSQGKDQQQLRSPDPRHVSVPIRTKASPNMDSANIGTVLHFPLPLPAARPATDKDGRSNVENWSPPESWNVTSVDPTSAIPSADAATKTISRSSKEESMVSRVQNVFRSYYGSHVYACFDVRGTLSQSLARSTSRRKNYVQFWLRNFFCRPILSTNTSFGWFETDVVGVKCGACIIF